MKRLLTIFLFANVLFSCQKNESRLQKPISAKPIISNVVTCGDTNRLAKINVNTWTCRYGSYILSFKNLRIRNHRVEGILDNITYGCTILTGQDYSRTYSFQTAGCNSPVKVTKTLVTESTYLMYIKNTTLRFSNTYVFYNGLTAQGISFDLESTLSTYQIDFQPITNTYTKTSYDPDPRFQCSYLVVFTGKLIAVKKGPDVQQNVNGLQPNYDYCVAPLCYNDAEITWLMPD